MFEIIMMVCLAATGEQCREFRLTDMQYEDAATCIRDSHLKASNWQSENVKFTLIGTRCAKNAIKIPEPPKS
ncbi:MAG: hypothetical protein QNJ62_02375 [Methyloceanibacter sp.]|nr:hypothetical protein [Methyloceanibacter sp.]